MSSKSKRADNFSLNEILERTIQNGKDDVKPLFKYLEVEKPDGWGKKTVKEKADFLEHRLREKGSHGLKNIVGKPAEYDDIVHDVGKKVKADVVEGKKAAFNEEKIIEKIFGDLLAKMTDQEKRELFESMGISEGAIPTGPITTVILKELLRRTGFGLYKVTLIVANAVAKALLGRGLTLATNALLMRGIGVLMGPVGWIASGAWLVNDLAGPAYRCTVPSIIHVALLRQMLLSRINIGIVGDGATGKDSMIKSVFDLDTKNVGPIAGTTTQMEVYNLLEDAVFLTNYPGFNDTRAEVDQELKDNLHHTDVFIMIVDINRGVSNIDVEIFNKVNEFNRPILVCLNKIDLIRTEKDRHELVQQAKRRIPAKYFIETVFDPDPRLVNSVSMGSEEVFDWVCNILIQEGKDTSELEKKLRRTKTE